MECCISVVPTVSEIPQKIATLQLACDAGTFVFDIEFAYDDFKTEFDELFHELFASERLKLGYQVDGDLRILHQLSEAFRDSQNVVELQVLEREVLGRTKKSGQMGLSKLCEAILGLPLDKSERVSNWSLRPLRRSQLEYAALDAWCQLGVFRECQKRLEAQALGAAPQ